MGPGLNEAIPGTLFTLPEDAAILRALDAYEGFAPAAPAQSLFLRTLVEVILPGGDHVEAWAYLFNTDEPAT